MQCACHVGNVSTYALYGKVFSIHMPSDLFACGSTTCTVQPIKRKIPPRRRLSTGRSPSIDILRIRRKNDTESLWIELIGMQCWRKGVPPQKHALSDALSTGHPALMHIVSHCEHVVMQHDATRSRDMNRTKHQHLSKQDISRNIDIFHPRRQSELPVPAVKYSKNVLVDDRSTPALLVTYSKKCCQEINYSTCNKLRDLQDKLSTLPANSPRLLPRPAYSQDYLVSMPAK